MKNIMTILFFLCATLGFAQGKSADERAAALTAKMQSEIKFNDDVKVKVQAINLDFVNKATALRNSKDGDRQANMEAMKKLDEERATSLKKVFSETEYAAFEKFREQNRQQVRERVKEKREENK